MFESKRKDKLKIQMQNMCSHVWFSKDLFCCSTTKQVLQLMSRKCSAGVRLKRTSEETGGLPAWCLERSPIHVNRIARDICDVRLTCICVDHVIPFHEFPYVLETSTKALKERFQKLRPPSQVMSFKIGSNRVPAIEIPRCWMGLRERGTVIVAAIYVYHYISFNCV